MGSQPKRPRPGKGYTNKLKGDSEPFIVEVDGRPERVRWEVGADAEGNRMRRLVGTWERISEGDSRGGT